MSDELGKEGVDKRGSMSYLQGKVNDQMKMRYGLAKVPMLRKRRKNKFRISKKRARSFLSLFFC